MKYIIEISGYATELCAGTVDDKKVFEFLKNEGDGSPNYDDAFEDEDGNSVDIIGYEIDNIIHCYGAQRKQASINVRVDSDEEKFNKKYDASDFDELYLLDYDYYRINLKNLKKEGVLALFLSTYNDKGLIASFELETEDFNPKYLRILTLNTEEIFGNDDFIIAYLFYISDEVLLEIYNKEVQKYKEAQKDGNCDYNLFTLDDLEKNKNECWEFFYEIFKAKYKTDSTIEEYHQANDYAKSEFFRIFGAYVLDEISDEFDTMTKASSGELIEL